MTVEFAEMPMLDAALRYVRLGWPVFPLGVRSKLPMVPAAMGGKGSEDATLSEEKVREWWGRWPKANIGLATGHRFIALDKDPRDGGEDSLAYLIQHHGRLPDTLEQTTGSGGVHYLFEQPNFRVRNSTGKLNGLAPGLDIRGYHGYILGAPSIHPETGRTYVWEGMQQIEEQKLAAAPAWLHDWLRKHSERATTVVPGTEPVKPAAERFPKGHRHNELLKIAGSMRRRGLSADEIFVLLKAVNERRCEPPYDEAHIRKMADSMEQYPPDARFRLLLSAVPEPAPEKADEPDKISALTLPDVEAAAADVIARNDLVGAARLIPDIAKLRPMFQPVILVMLKQHFKSDFPKDFERAVKDAMKAAAEGSESPADVPPEPPEAPPDSSPPPGGGPDLRWYPLTDAGNGERIRALFGDDVRYCHEMRSWLVWDARRWAVDVQSQIRQKMKQMARLLYSQSVAYPVIEKHARASEAYKAGTAALGYALSEKGIPISATDLDQQPYLLNCPNGLVNLRSGELLPHQRDFLVTKLCPVPYDPKAECPLFKSFIEWAMGGNPDAELTERTARLVGFLQRAFGYALTSDVSEKALFIFYGEKGNNGKTTLLTLMRHLLGRDYSTQISIETIMTASKNQDATMRADLADLRGMRFAITSEVEKEHRLNSRLIKYLVGGVSDIKSCRKYENPIEFPASHKLFMDCNHRPRITDDGDAIWKRLFLVPFDIRISDDDLDRQLPDKLRAELPGILAWLVRGAMAWLRDGLMPPPEVSAARDDWRQHDDLLKGFLEDCTEDGDKLFVSVREMGLAYEWWAKENRELRPLGGAAFNDLMEGKGYTQKRTRIDKETGKQFRSWEGLCLRDEVMANMRSRSAGPKWLGEQ